MYQQQSHQLSQQLSQQHLSAQQDQSQENSIFKSKYHLQNSNVSPTTQHTTPNSYNQFPQNPLSINNPNITANYRLPISISSSPSSLSTPSPISTSLSSTSSSFKSSSDNHMKQSIWTKDEDDLIRSKNEKNLTMVELSILLPKRTENEIKSRIRYFESPISNGNSNISSSSSLLQQQQLQQPIATTTSTTSTTNNNIDIPIF
ncbi:unnamed protein product [[Candida] boidinii]|nr:unnamed protein product [[Candida] boidinii]